MFKLTLMLTSDKRLKNWLSKQFNYLTQQTLKPDIQKVKKFICWLNHLKIIMW